MNKWLLACTAFLACGSFQTADSVPNDFGLPRHQQIRAQLEKTFVLDRNHSAEEWNAIILSAIQQANPKSEGLTSFQNQYLAKEVVRISQCYKIDPGVFAALIWRESNYKPSAVSETGAVGFTQMTQSGVHEVLERVSGFSPRRFKYLRALVHACNPKIYYRLPATVSSDVVAAWKNEIQFSPSTGLIFGAILLKINLAHVRVPYRTSTREIYRQALQKYNGDPKVKVRFAEDVLRLQRLLSVGPQIASIDPRFPRSAAQF